MPAVAAAVSYTTPGSFDASNIGAGIAGAIIYTDISYLQGNVLATTENMHNTTDQSSLPGGYDSAYLVNTTSTNSPIPLIYGARRVGGPVAYYNVTGNNILHVVTCVSLGVINDIYSIEIDGIMSDSYNEGEPRFPGFDYELRFGTDDQTAFPKLIAATSEWTVEHRLRGVAAIHTMHLGGQGSYDGFPSVTVMVDGKNIYDPRDTIVKYSSNPALVIRDYITNIQYGFGFEESLVDDYSFINSANYLDDINVEIHAIIDTSRNLEDNLKLMLGSCRGMLIYSNGKFSLKIDKPEISTFSFTEKNMMGDITIGFFNSSNRVNRAKVTWINRNSDFLPDIMPIENPALVIEDNGQVVVNEIDLPFTTQIDVAYWIGMMEIQQNRVKIPSLSFTAFEDAAQIAVGDVVGITNPAVSNDMVLMRVVLMRINQDHTININAVGYSDDAYIVGPTPITPGNMDSNVPDPMIVPTVTGAIFEESIYGVLGTGLISWNLNIDANYSYSVSYRLKGTSNWSNIINTYNNQLELINLAIGIYDIRINALNSVGGISSPVQIEGEITQAAVMPRVSGLELAGSSGNYFIFDEPNADFYWREASQTDSYQLGLEPTGGNSGGRDGYFSHYNVIIGYYQQLQDFVIVRNEITQNNHWSYTFDKNMADGGPRRNITIRVTQVGNQGQESPIIAEISVTNPAPEYPRNVKITPLFGRIDIETTPPDDLSDFKDMYVWQSLISGFDPTLFDPVVITNDTFVSIPGNVGMTYFLKVAYVDTFGPTTLNYSPEFEVKVLEKPDLTPPAIPENLQLIQENIITADGLVIPTIIATWEKVLDEDLQNYGWEIREETKAFTYGISDKNDFPSFEFSPIVSGSTYSIRVRAIDINGNESEYSIAENILITGDTIAPSAPTNLQVYGQFRGMLLLWEPPDDADLESFEIWESELNDQYTAILVGRDTKSPYLRSDLNAGDIRYYWVKAVDRSKNTSIFNSINGTFGIVSLLETGDVPNNLIVSNMVAANAINAEKIESNSITTDELAVNAVIAENISVGAVTTNSMTADSIDGNVITTNTLIGGKIIGDSITANELIKTEALIVGAEQVGDAVIETASIADAAVERAQIAYAAVDTAQIANAAIKTAQIADLAVETAQIAYAAVDTAQIADAAIETAQIANAAIITAQISNLAVDTAQINDLSIISGKMGGSSIITEKILDDAVTELVTAYHSGLEIIPPGVTKTAIASSISTIGKAEIDVIVMFTLIVGVEFISGISTSKLSLRIEKDDGSPDIFPEQLILNHESRMAPGPISIINFTVRDTVAANTTLRYAAMLTNSLTYSDGEPTGVVSGPDGMVILGRRK